MAINTNDPTTVAAIGAAIGAVLGYALSKGKKRTGTAIVVGAIGGVGGYYYAKSKQSPLVNATASPSTPQVGVPAAASAGQQMGASLNQPQIAPPSSLTQQAAPTSNWTAGSSSFPLQPLNLQ